MSKVKRGAVLVLIVLLVLTIGLSGCAQKAKEAPREKVVSTFNTLDNDYFIAWDNGAKQAAAALGIDYEAITTKGDGNKELTGIESAISSGATMFATVPIGMQSVPAITQLAEDKNVFMSITWEIPDWFTPIDVGDGFTTYLRPDLSAEAYTISKMLFEHLGGKGTVVYITGLPGTAGDLYVADGVDRAAAEYPDIKIVGRLPGNLNRVDSQKVMENLLTTYDEFDAIIGSNDATGLGALAALEAANKPIVPIVGLDGSKEMLDLIVEGKIWGTVSAFPEWQGGYGVVRAYDAAHGYKPKATERMMYTGYLVVTPENAQTYIDTMYGSDTLPFDWKLMSRAINPDSWDPQNSLIPIDPTEMWASAEKPADYELPKEYADALAGGEIAQTTKEYADHYKKIIIK